MQIVNSLAPAPILEEVHVVGRPGPGLGLRPHRVGARDRRQVEEGRHFVLAGKQTSAETIEMTSDNIALLLPVRMSTLNKTF